MNKLLKFLENGFTKVFVVIILTLLLFSCSYNDSRQSKIFPVTATSESELESLDNEDPWHLFEKPFGIVIPLNGIWDIAEGNMKDIPSEFNRKVQVPGLVTLAKPAFENVGMSGYHKAFWYRRTLTINENQPTAFLKVFKAKYGTKVYINRKEVGYNSLSFTSSLFNITPYLNQAGHSNEIVIRIGAHIDALPDTVTTGGEVEKFKYMPGIYDNVELILTDEACISKVQVVPNIHENKVYVHFEINNNGKSATKKIWGEVFEYNTGKPVGKSNELKIKIDSNEKLNLDFSIPIENFHLWTPEDPFLYILRITDGKYDYQTRFGMRSFRLDSTKTNLALLNEKPYYFRGTNVALFRFFEDPESGNLPWDRKWVRKLFRKYKSLGLNSIRTCISSFPKFWYELADEEGLALFAEYPIWYALKEGVSWADFEKERQDPTRKYGIYPEKLNTARLVNEYTQWMQDLWNHASVIAWDAQNETWSKHTGEAINIVRSIDLSNRPWDNGWSPPASKSDWREGHTYFARYNVGSEAKNALEKVAKPFTLADLKTKEKIPKTLYSPYQHAYKLPLNNYTEQPCLLNEYGYLWLNRDGSPTSLTKPYYDAVLGRDADPDVRREHYAYMLAAITEYWRAARTCFGVNYPFGLAHSLSHGATSDNLANVKELEFDPYFIKYMTSAFSPTGVCLEVWDNSYSTGSYIDAPVILTNDTDSLISGNLTVSIFQNNTLIYDKLFSVSAGPWEQKRTYFRVNFPKTSGNYQMIANFANSTQSIKSIRKIELIDLKE